MIKVTAAVIEKNGKYLIAKRRQGDYLENKWEFPGGKLKEGENPKECLKRELREELGIESEIDQFICSSIYKYPKLSIELLAYRAKYMSGDIKVKDHEEIKWINIEDFDKYVFAPADLPVIQKLLGR